jgi:ubiquitin C-terminal hydrolase
LARLVRNFQICKNHTKWKLEHILYIGNAKYVLRAVVCHIGTSADYGHYVTVSNGVCYDDELVTEMQYDTIKPEDIYMLFYIKV